jgi:hypothetical protein
MSVELPTVLFEGHESTPEYVYPSSGSSDGDPASWSYDFAADVGGCWSGAIDGYPPMSGAAFYYCPAGAEPGDWTDLNGDASVDRVLMGQDDSTYAYVRADN